MGEEALGCLQQEPTTTKNTERETSSYDQQVNKIDSLNDSIEFTLADIETILEKFSSDKSYEYKNEDLCFESKLHRGWHNAQRLEISLERLQRIRAVLNAHL